MKTALITGASRGIGLNLASTLSQRGYKVFAVSRGSSSELDKLTSGGNLSVVKADISTDQGIHQVAKVLEGQALDLLINNAGILLGAGEPFSSMDFDKLRESLAVNLEAPMKLTQALLPNLKKASSPKVAQITSKMGSIADNSSGGYYAYRISKTALNMFNKSFSVDHPQITTLVLHPGWVKTEMGGSSAPVEPKESAQGLVDVIEKATLKDSGRFFAYSGENIPW